MIGVRDIAVVAAFFIFIAASLTYSLHARRQAESLCHRNGYPRVVAGHCVRVENGSDVMVPFEALR